MGVGRGAPHAAETVAKAMDRMREELPPLSSVLDAFRELVVASARLKSSLALPESVLVAAPDPARFEQGAPLVAVETLLEVGDGWKTAIDRLMPAMEQGFPKIRGELRALKEALVDGRWDPKSCLHAMHEGRAEVIEQAAQNLACGAQTLKFVAGQLLKPFVEQRAASLRSLIQDLHWHKGYCPICGCLPELGYFTEDGGERWLRCGLCAHTWRFARIMCPFCENDDQETLEFFFVEDREHERAELCLKCRRYLLTLDLRKRAQEVVLDVASLGLVHLEVLAQQKGFLPVAAVAWNVVAGEDIAAAEVSLADRPGSQ
jgi:FdhE protein